MKLLILTSSFYPDPIGIAPLTAELAQDLCRRGADTQVATAFPHYPQWSIPPQYRGKWWAREKWKGVEVLRTWLRVSKKATAASKMVYYSTFSASAAVGSLKWKLPDVMLVVSPPLSLSLTSSFVRLFRRCSAVLLVCDLLPDTAVALGMIKNKLFIKLLYAFERWSYRRFDRIVVVSNAFRDKLLEKGVPADKVSVIYTWVDTNFIRPLPRENSFRDRHSCQSKFVVLYAGNIGISQGLETVLHAARLLRDNSDIEFLIVGDGTGSAALRATAEQMAIPSVRFLPLQPREDIPYMYGAADVCLIMQRRDVLDINLPGKIQTIMSAGRPLIAATHAEGEVTKIVSISQAGLHVEPENAAQLSNAILSLYLDRELGNRLGGNGREYAIKQFSRDSAITSYVDLFRDLVPLAQNKLDDQAAEMTVGQ